jgi:hypothetical protein
MRWPWIDYGNNLSELSIINYLLSIINYLIGTLSPNTVSGETKFRL